MSSRPSVIKTYGRPKLASSSSSSIFFESSPAPNPFFSSSPPPSDPIITPGRSPKRRRYDDNLDKRGEPFSPLFSRDDSPTDDEETCIDVKPVSSLQKGKVVVQPSIKGFFSALPRRTALAERTTIPPVIRPTPAAILPNTKKSQFTQLHLTHLPLLHTCKECSMSYVRGGEDESLHAKHHIKVVRGMTWDGLGKGKAKATSGESRGGWRVIQENVGFCRKGGKEKGEGRVIMCDGSWGGNKLQDILSTVDIVLSSPSLPPAILDHCKIFLLVTSSPPPLRRAKPLPTRKKDGLKRIVGIVVSQPIKTAMRVLGPGDVAVKVVDSGGGVVCDPEQLPTPLGIHRLFTIPSYRSLSIAQHLLEAACNHTVYGCTFDPQKGEVAFSQPTESGRKAMERLGGGNVRVFVDDERQI